MVQTTTGRTPNLFVGIHDLVDDLRSEIRYLKATIVFIGIASIIAIVCLALPGEENPTPTETQDSYLHEEPGFHFSLPPENQVL